MLVINRRFNAGFFLLGISPSTKLATSLTFAAQSFNHGQDNTYHRS